ncbi:MAG TPA: DUF4410 domain-containing protein [Candidatus Binatia bacterium]
MLALLRGPGRTYIRAAILAALVTSLSACAQTAVRPSLRTAAGHLPRPARILIVDVLTDEARVTEYNGILRQQPANPNPADRHREIRHVASAAFETGLTDGLEKLGFTIARVARGTTVAEDDILIDGRCLTIDQGNPLRRLVIGFGSGASRFETFVGVYGGPEQRKLLEFTTLADSGSLPGAALTLPVGAAVQGGVSAGLLASSAVSSGFAVYRTDVSQMAASSADEAVRYLSEFFANQGWISPHQVRKARIAHHAQSSSEDRARR